jgi:hypothetical protein
LVGWFAAAAPDFSARFLAAIPKLAPLFGADSLVTDVMVSRVKEYQQGRPLTLFYGGLTSRLLWKNKGWATHGRSQKRQL